MQVPHLYALKLAALKLATYAYESRERYAAGGPAAGAAEGPGVPEFASAGGLTAASSALPPDAFALKAPALFCAAAWAAFRLKLAAFSAAST